jgi:hypothetical protein
MHAAELDPQARDTAEFEECSAYMLRTVRNIDTFVTKYAARLTTSKNVETAKVCRHELFSFSTVVRMAFSEHVA